MTARTSLRSPRICLPPLALFIAVLALVGLLGATAWAAWTAWPTAVLAMYIFAGVLVASCLQFFVYGFHAIALCLAWILHGVWFGVGYVGTGCGRFRARPGPGL